MKNLILLAFLLISSINFGQQSEKCLIENLQRYADYPKDYLQSEIGENFIKKVDSNVNVTKFIGIESCNYTPLEVVYTKYDSNYKASITIYEAPPYLVDSLRISLSSIGEQDGDWYEEDDYCRTWADMWFSYELRTREDTIILTCHRYYDHDWSKY